MPNPLATGIRKGDGMASVVVRFSEGTFQTVRAMANGKNRSWACQARHLIAAARQEDWAGEIPDSHPVHGYVSGGRDPRYRNSSVLMRVALPEQVFQSIVTASAEQGTPSFAEAIRDLVDTGIEVAGSTPLDVPSWVIAAGLKEDFLDYARLHGEEEAASRCRALKREAVAA